MIFPKGSDIFKSFNLTPFEKVKVVIIGQDPYHGFGQAHGLCFSVPQGVKAPPSLVNIYKEINRDLGFLNEGTGNLESWAKQEGLAFKLCTYRGAGESCFSQW